MSSPASRPIAVMSFDRPHYLEPVLRSLKAQMVPVPLKADDVVLFQDGYRSRSGADITDPRLVERCVELFETIFPGSPRFVSADNLGVAWNFARAEDYAFRQLGAEVAFFFEDDLVLSPYYLITLEALTQLALKEKRIAYVAAYGDHRAKLSEQRLSPKRLILMRHKWGFALTRRQWEAQREIVEPYLEIVGRTDYRARDHVSIREYFRKLGFGATGTSQDGMKDVASCILGTTKTMTFACFGKYIGEVGLHSKKEIYDQERFAETTFYPGAISAFELPSGDQLDEWILSGQSNARKVLREMVADPMQQVRVGIRESSKLGELDTSPNTMGNPGAHSPSAIPTGADTNVGAPSNVECSQLKEDFIRTLFRVFLLREPDDAALASGLRQFENGRTLEDLMRWCLQSEEFGQNIRSSSKHMPVVAQLMHLYH